jgi:hypothetical protein
MHTFPLGWMRYLQHTKRRQSFTVRCYEAARRVWRSISAA